VDGVDDFGRELVCLLYGLAWAVMVLATAVAVLVALILAGVL